MKIRMYTTTYCPDCWRAKSFLKSRRVAYEEINIEETPGAAEFVAAANHGKRCVPTFELDGRTFHCSPYDPAKLASELGLDSRFQSAP
ncbi:MAG TPA: glutaredoxin family protein [Terriglobia bacterium]|nr:glutaredoxin family protein [Terriglobia bacterium]